MASSIENSSTYGEAIRGVGIKFKRMKKKKAKKKTNKGKKAYLTYE